LSRLRQLGRAQVGGCSERSGHAHSGSDGAASGDASPWVQPKGDTYARIARAREEVQGLHAHRLNIYAKRGLSDDWTLTAEAETLAFDEADDFNATGYRLPATG